MSNVKNKLEEMQEWLLEEGADTTMLGPCTKSLIFGIYCQRGRSSLVRLLALYATDPTVRDDLDIAASSGSVNGLMELWGGLSKVTSALEADSGNGVSSEEQDQPDVPGVHDDPRRVDRRSQWPLARPQRGEPGAVQVPGAQATWPGRPGKDGQSGGEAPPQGREESAKMTKQFCMVAEHDWLLLAVRPMNMLVWWSAPRVDTEASPLARPNLYRLVGGVFGPEVVYGKLKEGAGK